jgi:hypothetical protein
MATEIDKILSDAAEQIKREAYTAGWNDAIEAMKSALSGLGTPSVPETLKIPNGAGADTAGARASTNSAAGPTVGSTPYYVLNAVKAKPGMASTEVVEAVRSGGHPAPEGSIRTTIFRLRDRKFIVSRHGKWFPA